MLIHFLPVVLLLMAVLWLPGCQSEKASASGKTPAPSTVHLEDFVVNLADLDGRSYLRVGMDLLVEGEVPKGKSDQHSAVVPVIRDSVITVLGVQKAEDLLAVDGKTRLKQDLIKALNDRMPELNVREIYFNDFMVQR